jgi:hypothetical protein
VKGNSLPGRRSALHGEPLNRPPSAARRSHVPGQVNADNVIGFPKLKRNLLERPQLHSFDVDLARGWDRGGLARRQPPDGVAVLTGPTPVLAAARPRRREHRTGSAGGFSAGA